MTFALERSWESPPASEGEDSGDCTTLSEQPAMWSRRRASDRSEASKEGHKQNLRRRSCGVKALRAFLWEGGGGKVGKRGESWSAARRPVSCTQITFIVAHSCTQIRWTLQCNACTRLYIDPFHSHHKLKNSCTLLDEVF